MNSKYKLATAAAAVIAIAAGGLTMGSAYADPSGAPTYRTLAGVGSDTTEGVVAGLSDGVTSLSLTSSLVSDGTIKDLAGATIASGTKIVGSYNAQGTSTIKTKAAALCDAVTRQNGSGAGKTGLLASLNNVNTPATSSATGDVNTDGTITNVSSTTGVQVGLQVTGTNIPAGTFVTGVSGTTISTSGPTLPTGAVTATALGFKGDGCLQFSRSSSGGSGTNSPALTYVPFALDAVDYAVTPTSNVSRTLRKSDLQGYYTCNTDYVTETITSISVTAGGSGYASAPTVTITGNSSQGSGATATAVVTSGAVTAVNLTNAGSGYGSITVSFSGGGGTGAAAKAVVTSDIKPVLPQAGSGTRSFWETQMGIADADVVAGKYPCIIDGTYNSQIIEEHTGTFLTDNMLVPFSIPQYNSQATQLLTDRRGRAQLASIASGGTSSAPTGITSPNKVNTSFNITRSVYNVIPTALKNTSPWREVFNGGSSLACNSASQAIIQAYGFGLSGSCGDVSNSY